MASCVKINPTNTKNSLFYRMSSNKLLHVMRIILGNVLCISSPKLFLQIKPQGTNQIADFQDTEVLGILTLKRKN